MFKSSLSLSTSMLHTEFDSISHCQKIPQMSTWGNWCKQHWLPRAHTSCPHIFICPTQKPPMAHSTTFPGISKTRIIFKDFSGAVKYKYLWDIQR